MKARRCSTGFPRSPPLRPIQATLTVSPTQPRRLVRSVLATWTGVLVVLIVSAIRSIPPVLPAILLPYLALVAWHLLPASARSKDGRDPLPEGPGGMPDPGPGPGESTSPQSASLDDGAESTEFHESIPAPATGQRASTTTPARARKRPRPRVAEPPPAAWVQVGPGRFVRGEEPDPSPDASEDTGAIADRPGSPSEPSPAEAARDDERAHEGMASDDPMEPTGASITPHGTNQLGDGVISVQEPEACPLPVAPDGAESQHHVEGPVDTQLLHGSSHR
jgi:hypothetical protein